MIDEMSLDVPCPGCGHEVVEDGSRLKTDPELVCPACGNAFLVDVDQLARELEEADKKLSETGGTTRIGN